MFLKTGFGFYRAGLYCSDQSGLQSLKQTRAILVFLKDVFYPACGVGSGICQSLLNISLRLKGWILELNVLKKIKKSTIKQNMCYFHCKKKASDFDFQLFEV